MAVKHVYVNNSEIVLDDDILDGDPVGYLFEWVADICRNLGYSGEYGGSYINGGSEEGGDPGEGGGCGES